MGGNSNHVPLQSARYLPLGGQGASSHFGNDHFGIFEHTTKWAIFASVRDLCHLPGSTSCCRRTGSLRRTDSWCTRGVLVVWDTEAASYDRGKGLEPIPDENLSRLCWVGYFHNRFFGKSNFTLPKLGGFLISYSTRNRLRVEYCARTQHPIFSYSFEIEHRTRNSGEWRTEYFPYSTYPRKLFLIFVSTTVHDREKCFAGFYAKSGTRPRKSCHHSFW